MASTIDDLDARFVLGHPALTEVRHHLAGLDAHAFEKDGGRLQLFPPRVPVVRIAAKTFVPAFRSRDDAKNLSFRQELQQIRREPATLSEKKGRMASRFVRLCRAD